MKEVKPKFFNKNTLLVISREQLGKVYGGTYGDRNGLGNDPQLRD